MKNYEKYADEIKKYKDYNFCGDFVKPYILESDNCNGLDCIRCSMLQAIWLLEEYKEPEVNWSKVAVDTPILVRDSENSCWHKVHFAKYKDGEIYAGANGGTSWSSRWTCRWKYAKLAENEE